jgi:WD40 repeat protein
LSALSTITPENADALEPLWTETPHQGLVYGVAISPDGRTVASCGLDGEIFLLDAANGEIIREFSGHTESVEQVLFSPDGETLASLSSDGSFRLWDVATGDEQLVFDHNEPLFYMAFSPGGRWIAYSSYVNNPESSTTESSTVWLVDSQDERERAIITLEDTLFVNSVAFSPDSDQLLFSASNDQDPDARQTNVWLWDIERDQEIDSWIQEGNPVDVFFTPTGRPYATMNDIRDPNDLLVWDVSENYIQHRLTGFDDLTYHVVLNLEGTIMGAASYDGTVRLWKFDDGEELAVLEHEGAAYGVALSDDGRLVATSDDLGNVVLWGVVGNANV